MEIGVTGSGRLQRPDRLAGISEASNSIGGIGAVALIQLMLICIIYNGHFDKHALVAPPCEYMYYYM